MLLRRLCSTSIAGVLLSRLLRRPGIEPRSVRSFHSLPSLLNSCSARSFPSVTHCADRELNPGYELGKLMCYHYTTGASFAMLTRALLHVATLRGTPALSCHSSAPYLASPCSARHRRTHSVCFFSGKLNLSLQMKRGEGLIVQTDIRCHDRR